jgi:hypothetical protein
MKERVNSKNKQLEANVKRVSRSVRAEISRKAIEKRRKRVPQRFVFFLSFVSILGFLGIATESLTPHSISGYIESGLILLLGVGLLLEADLRSLGRVREAGLSENKFNRMVTAILAILAILTAVLSFPLFGLSQENGLMAVKGIIALIAMIFIGIQIWVLRD